MPTWHPVTPTASSLVTGEAEGLESKQGQTEGKKPGACRHPPTCCILAAPPPPPRMQHPSRPTQTLKTINAKHQRMHRTPEQCNGKGQAINKQQQQPQPTTATNWQWGPTHHSPNYPPTGMHTPPAPKATSQSVPTHKPYLHNPYMKEKQAEEKKQTKSDTTQARNQHTTHTRTEVENGGTHTHTISKPHVQT